MRFPRIIHSAVLMPAVVIGSMARAAPAAAQDGFMFKPPAVTLGFWVGRTMQSTHSDIYDQLTQTLTLERGDFAAVSYGGDVAFRAGRQIDVVAGLGYAKSTASSESRDFEGTDNLPIVQTTQLTRLPITAGMRFYPMKRGSELGRYAWVPSKFTPYVGAGAGLMHYSLLQAGEFVDEGDLSIFAAQLESRGNSPMAYGEAGAGLWFNSRVGITGNARYTWSKSAMQGDFETFNDIDLRGFQASAGFAVRF